MDKCWVVIGRNEKENKIIESLKSGEVVIPNYIGPSAVILDKFNKKIKDKVNELIIAYSKKGDLEQRKKFDKWKL